jgi:hypothetical protein
MTELQTPPSPDTLLKLLERQQALAEQLAGLAERQAALIEAGDSDALLSLLSQRQKIMDQFLASQDSLAGLSDSCRRHSELPDGARDRIRSLIHDISRRLSDIMNVDEQDRARLESSRPDGGDPLAGLNKARAARHAYVNSQPGRNRFADSQG